MLTLGSARRMSTSTRPSSSTQARATSRAQDIESASFNGNIETSMEQRLRCAVYGDLETMEHAKTRVLIMIDQLVSFSSPAAVAASAQN
jgi:hypothetical protein